jgi:hypothetical protein
MKNLLLICLLSFGFSFTGCIVYEKVSYDINITGKDSGSVTTKFYDIKSDAIGNKEFEEDKKALFEFMLKSDDFLTSMQQEGKDITSRKLYLDGKKLNGEGVYFFKNINDVEGIVHQGGFYYLTLELKDSVLSTNGQVVYSEERKRILWDDSMTNLKFVMRTDVTVKDYRDLSQFYKEK